MHTNSLFWGEDIKTGANTGGVALQNWECVLNFSNFSDLFIVGHKECVFD